MNDERAVEVIDQWLWDEGFSLIGDVTPYGEAVLAALRAEGYEIYRPDDCRTGTMLLVHTSEGGFPSGVFPYNEDTFDDLPLGSVYRLVPVGGEG